MPRLEFSRKVRAEICIVDGCDGAPKTRGYCNAHYLRLLRYGDVAASRPRGTHGMYGTPEHRAWRNMKSRCYNPKTPLYERYGGRGIAVCDEWRDSFEAFFRDVGARPTSKHSLDRWPDPNGDYEPANVRWATAQEQSRNLTNNRLVEIDGKKMTLAEAVERAPVPYNTVLYRLRRGWSIEAAISHPAHKGFRPDA